ncbi:hypothetical protein I4F81_010506 [Pyropia yezoensis]|uniref:Uncharacterized protein n=1 Tax=Pyropia yezoensis TaxID=2788 RepID=A0ACC3CCH5_PYRYE|nr:hypothetical protein I4F81_010506 [Neopyropia yezoensis]
MASASTPLLPTDGGRGSHKAQGFTLPPLPPAHRLSVDWTGTPLSAGTPLPHATIPASVLNLSACAFGASILSIPHAFAAAGGPAAGIATLVAVAAASAWSAGVMADAGRATGAPALRSIIGATFGLLAGAATDMAVCGALAVAAVSYVCGVVELVPLLLPSLFGWMPRLGLVVGTVVALAGPCLVGDLAAFGPTSAIALASPTRQRLHAVVRWSVVTLTSCYVPFGLAGLLLYATPGPEGALTAHGTGVPLNVLAGVGDGSPVVTVARVAIAALLVLTYPLLVIPLRRRVEAGVWGAVQPAGGRRVAVVAALSVGVGAVSGGLRDLGAANDVAGGAIAVIMFVVPGGLSAMRGWSELREGEGKTAAWTRMAVGGGAILLGLVTAAVGLGGLFF